MTTFDPNKAIEEINKSCKDLFPESTFYFHRKSDYRFISSGNNPSEAINNYDDISGKVKVIKWFDDFWVYGEINFMRVEIEARFREGIKRQDYLNRLSESLLKIGKAYFETTITLSVFQGVAADDSKSQLFRAEWDNRLDDGTHPQPHWHICPDFRLKKSFESFIKTIDEGTDFRDIVNEEKPKCVDLARIHFAMNGQWSAQGAHFHKISHEDALKNWFRGLLGHIKCELQYVSTSGTLRT